MIIIEGPDNTGKTTLANHLSSVTGLPVTHSIKPDSVRHGKEILNIMTENPLRIYDRVSCISEAIYGPILRSKSIYKNQHWNILDVFLRNRPLIICCMCSKEEALSFKGREDMEGVQDSAEQLYDKYLEVFNKVSALVEINGGNLVFYNYETSNAGYIDNTVINHIDHLRSHQRIIGNMSWD